MKHIFGIWREYLEGGSNIRYQIYCDLDGVLVDFEKGAMELINDDLRNPENIAELSDKIKKYYSN